MKKSFFVLAFLTAFVFSCQKSTMKPEVASEAITSADDASVLRNNFRLLTANPWVYTKYYVNHLDSANPGQLAYKRGRERNQIILDSTVISFLADGTYDEKDESGNHLLGTWSFSDPEQTIISVTDAAGGTTSRQIMLLSRRKFFWSNTLDSVAAQMVPQP